MKDIYNAKVTKVLDLILILGIVIMVAPWYYYYYQDSSLYLSNPDTEYFGPPINCTQIEPIKIECIKIYGDMLYPKEPYIKEVNPFVYWIIQNQVSIVIAIITYLAITRIGMFKKKKNE